jgi:transposase
MIAQRRSHSYTTSNGGRTHLQSLPKAADKIYAEGLLKGLRKLFGTIHKKDQLSEVQFNIRLDEAKQEIMRSGTQNVPWGLSKPSLAMAKRLKNYGEQYFQFLTTPEIDATNNVAEQAIRFVVIDRVITQGTRSEAGQKFCERIWTAIATCGQTGKSVWEFLLGSVQGYFAGTQKPKLTTAGTAQ